MSEQTQRLTFGAEVWVGAADAAETFLVETERTDDDEIRLGLQRSGEGSIHIYLSIAATRELADQLSSRADEKWGKDRR